MDSATISDSIFQQTLELVEAILPPSQSSSSASSSTEQITSTTKDKNVIVLIPNRRLVEELVDKAAAAWKQAPALVGGKKGEKSPSLIPSDKQRAKELFDRVFAKAPPGWRSKLAGVGGGGWVVTKTPTILIKGPKRKQPEVGRGRDGGGPDPANKKARI